ncbi:MAG: hypothetical protein K8S94_09050 [Planctomycetia bacterium]|nr:hypothetical protein [Planctomycetia bacterium]
MIAVQAAITAAALASALAQASDLVAVEPLKMTARRAGLRVLESTHLVLATDRPARDGDGVDDLPRVFDEAFAAWCRHYRLPPESLRTWRAFGCLVVDRERFRTAGLLPDAIPEFVNGFCDRNRFWLMDQSNSAYRRHLLLHEGVHAFTLTVRSLATPTWYNEGIAEYLATHRLEGVGNAGRYVPTPMPDRATDVEQLGRIENLRDVHAAGTAPALADVLATPPGHHTRIADYASSWAAVAMFAGHPAYATAFRELERGTLDAEFNTRLAALPGYDPPRAARDFEAFIDDLDYGYDFARSAIDWSAGSALESKQRIDVAAGRGWQNAGFALAKGRRYDLLATGRCTIGSMKDATIESEADGISLDWYRGRPLGRLLAAQWVDRPADGGRPRFMILGDGARATLTAVTDGPLYVKLNEPPGSLADDKGSLAVDIQPASHADDRP